MLREMLRSTGLGAADDRARSGGAWFHLYRKRVGIGQRLVFECKKHPAASSAASRMAPDRDLELEPALLNARRRATNLSACIQAHSPTRGAQNSDRCDQQLVPHSAPRDIPPDPHCVLIGQATHPPFHFTLDPLLEAELDRRARSWHGGALAVPGHRRGTVPGVRRCPAPRVRDYRRRSMS